MRMGVGVILGKEMRVRMIMRAGMVMGIGVTMRIEMRVKRGMGIGMEMEIGKKKITLGVVSRSRRAVSGGVGVR